MPRLASIDPATGEGAGAEMLRGPLKDKQINIFRHLAVNPGVLKAFLGFSGGVKTGVLTAKEHEVVALTVAQRRDCDYCLAAHTALATGAGFSDDEVLSIRRGSPSDDRHAALATFTRRILETDGYVDDADLEAFRAAGYDDAAVIEVIGEITVNVFTTLFNHLNGTEVDFPEVAAV